MVPLAVSPAVAAAAVAVVAGAVAVEEVVAAVVSMLRRPDLVPGVPRLAVVTSPEVAVPVGSSAGPSSPVCQMAWVVSPVQFEGVVWASALAAWLPVVVVPVVVVAAVSQVVRPWPVSPVRRCRHPGMKPRAASPTMRAPRPACVSGWRCPAPASEIEVCSQARPCHQAPIPSCTRRSPAVVALGAQWCGAPRRRPRARCSLSSPTS